MFHDRLKHAWNLVNYPVTGVIVGVLVALFLFLLARATVAPRYAVSLPELIAGKSDQAPKMKIMWENEEVRNVNAAKIAIWNNGKKYLDARTLSATDPIRIVPSQKIRILSAQTIRTSRNSLNVTTSIDSEQENRPCVRVAIGGDDALEKHDGVLVKILYTGPKDCEFSVKGRVKGHPSGFQRVRWGSVASGKVASFMVAGGAVFYTFFGLYMVVYGIRRLRVGRMKFGVLHTANGLLILGFSLYLFLSRASFLLGPGWLE